MSLALLQSCLGEQDHEEWAAWIRARDPICCSCRLAATRVADHVIPKLIGGEATDENGQGMCHECHSGKRAQERELYPVFRSAIDRLTSSLGRPVSPQNSAVAWKHLVEERGLDLRTLKPLHEEITC
jgi:hypothetical protein